MKAHWDAHDYRIMRSKPLGFTGEDIRLIRSGLAARTAHAAPPGAVPDNGE